MDPVAIFRTLFTEEELKQLLNKARENLSKELKGKNYWTAACLSFDLARIYTILQNEKESKHYYRVTLEYLDRADFQSLWMRVECLRALGKNEKALETVLSNPPHNQRKLAEFYSKLGKSKISQQLYVESAKKESLNPDEMENFMYPQWLQYISDLWEKANNNEKKREYNQMALKMWEETENIMNNLYPIEKAWMYEGIGYIYEKADNVVKAMNYYKRAKKEYELACKKEYLASSETHHIDGDWDYYMKFFYFQLPEILMINLLVDHFMKVHLRRIEYRIISLKEQIKDKAGIHTH